jgi:hypothetical protein
MAKKSKQSYATMLAEANKFDPSALPANRKGEFTANQRLKLNMALTSTFFSALLGVVVGIVFLVLGILWFPFEDLFSEWIMIVVSIITFLLGISWIFQGGKSFRSSFLPLLKDVLGEKLIIKEGQVKKEYDDQHYKSMWHRLLDLVFEFISDSDSQYSSDLFSGTYFYLYEDHQFIVSQKAFNALDERTAHILYFMPRSKKMINIEPAPK